MEMCEHVADEIDSLTDYLSRPVLMHASNELPSNMDTGFDDNISPLRWLMNIQ